MMRDEKVYADLAKCIECLKSIAFQLNKNSGYKYEMIEQINETLSLISEKSK